MAILAAAQRKLVTTLLLVTLCSAGCGTTQIITTEPRARISVDGRSLGRGRAEIDKRGSPGSVTVLVNTEDGRREQQQIRRSFTLTTLLLGVLTYGVCLIACWEYPDTVFIQLPDARRGGVGDPSPSQDPWLLPPPGWQKPPGTTP